MNNLVLNRTKSAEIVITRARIRCVVVDPPSAVPGFARVEWMKVLGVTFNKRVSFDKHINEVLVGCSQILYALRTLQSHGMPPKDISTSCSRPLSKQSCATLDQLGTDILRQLNVMTRLRVAFDERCILDIGQQSLLHSTRSSRAPMVVSLRVLLCTATTLSTTYFRQSAANSAICVDALITSCCPPNTTLNNSNFVTRLLNKNNCYQ